VSPLAEAKRADRASALARRAAAHAAATGAAEAAARHLLTLLEDGPGITAVSGYLPIRDEIDPLPAMRALIARGLRVAVPVIAAKATPLGFREWTPDGAMVSGPFGTRAPATGGWMTPELLIVPLLAFDRAGHRLGYGGGYYDRTIAGLRDAGPVRAVGIAYAGQEVARVPVEETDAPLDAVVTEAGVVLPAAGARG
jgi:5-formyltetrahydrofolate cyclo-ligase